MLVPTPFVPVIGVNLLDNCIVLVRNKLVKTITISFQTSVDNNSTSSTITYKKIRNFKIHELGNYIVVDLSSASGSQVHTSQWPLVSCAFRRSCHGEMRIYSVLIALQPLVNGALKANIKSRVFNM